MASKESGVILPDVLRPGLAIVFCGTAPSRRSAADRAYYAKPGNKFWRTLHRIGLTPRQFAPSEYAGILEHGLGLTDLSKGSFGQDAELNFSDADRLRLARTIHIYRPRVLAFTSKNAAEKFFGHKVQFGRQPGAIRGALGSEVFVLPSTSGLACRSWNEAPWRELAKFVRP